MAFAARATMQEENNVMVAKDAKTIGARAAQALQQGSKRSAPRAPLVDVSNISGPLNNRNAAGKDGKAADPLAATKARTLSRGKEVTAPAAANAPTTALAARQTGAAPVPRTRSQTLAARQQGMSMSSLLQQRSEAAVTAKKAPAPLSPLPDIDIADRGNPLAATEYVNDIYSYYRRVEPKFRVQPGYMANQTDINEKMRAILIDWLVEVHLKFKLMPETLFLTVNLIDRYLEIKPVTRRNLQLVGVTAMLIASKYEEIWAPEVRDFVYISDKAYTREQILAMEKAMLNTLHFNLTLPTPHNFLARFLKAANSHLDKQVTNLSNYMVELAAVDASMLKYSYSTISAAALYVSMRTFDKVDPFPKALARHSGYTEASIMPCAAALVGLVQKAPTASLNAVFKKYSNVKLGEVAKTEVCVAILDEVDSELL